jgi:hypothetical protein
MPFYPHSPRDTSPGKESDYVLCVGTDFQSASGLRIYFMWRRRETSCPWFPSQRQGKDQAAVINALRRSRERWRLKKATPGVIVNRIAQEQRNQRLAAIKKNFTGIRPFFVIPESPC